MLGHNVWGWQHAPPYSELGELIGTAAQLVNALALASTNCRSILSEVAYDNAVHNIFKFVKFNVHFPQVVIWAMQTLNLLCYSDHVPNMNQQNAENDAKMMRRLIQCQPFSVDAKELDSHFADDMHFDQTPSSPRFREAKTAAHSQIAKLIAAVMELKYHAIKTIVAHIAGRSSSFEHQKKVKHRRQTNAAWLWPCRSVWIRCCCGFNHVDLSLLWLWPSIAAVAVIKWGLSGTHVHCD